LLPPLDVGIGLVSVSSVGVGGAGLFPLGFGLSSSTFGVVTT
jgi:hypothetical protein